MHTIDLIPEIFDVEIDSHHTSLDEVFPGWGVHDRFGIVLDRPYGVVGASLLIQAAIAKFFQHRADLGLDEVPMYPEIYAFHIGGPHGDLSLYDFWPATKEVFLPADPCAALQAINDRAITRLAIPDGPLSPSSFLWPEYGSAHNRLSSCWAYSPSGQAANSDVLVGCASSAVEMNTVGTLDLTQYISERKNEDAATFAQLMREDRDFQRWIARTVDRQDEVPAEVRSEVAELHARKLIDQQVSESYRRVDLTFALDRLTDCCSSAATGTSDT